MAQQQLLLKHMVLTRRDRALEGHIFWSIGYLLWQQFPFSIFDHANILHCHLILIINGVSFMMKNWTLLNFLVCIRNAYSIPDFLALIGFCSYISVRLNHCPSILGESMLGWLIGFLSCCSWHHHYNEMIYLHPWQGTSGMAVVFLYLAIFTHHVIPMWSL